MAVTLPLRSHRVEQIMGTAIGIDVRGAGLPDVVIDSAFARLRYIDARFSPYLPDSDVSRMIRGELDEADGTADLRAVLGLCEDLRRTSDGYFDIRRHRPDGRPDPTGLVKGWAIEEAAFLLEAAGALDFTINAGGDIVAHGEPEPGRAWQVGIRHPDQPDRVAAVLRIRDVAVATSGAYERGEHIIDPHDGRPARELLSLTVVGPSLTYADAYATAAFAMGSAGPAWVHGHPGYGAFAIGTDRRAVWTPRIDSLLL
ncbi:MAG: FAD:protein FMN transferase [Chloroflexota bacterium]|nr:FAD:protein FMN transferase [Chloroflexota bacterium]